MAGHMAVGLRGDCLDPLRHDPLHPRPTSPAKTTDKGHPRSGSSPSSTALVRSARSRRHDGGLAIFRDTTRLRNRLRPQRQHTGLHAVRSPARRQRSAAVTLTAEILTRNYPRASRTFATSSSWRLRRAMGEAAQGRGSAAYTPPRRRKKAGGVYRSLPDLEEGSPRRNGGR